MFFSKLTRKFNKSIFSQSQTVAGKTKPKLSEGRRRLVPDEGSTISKIFILCAYEKEKRKITHMVFLLTSHQRFLKNAFIWHRSRQFLTLLSWAGKSQSCIRKSVWHFSHLSEGKKWKVLNWVTTIFSIVPLHAINVVKLSFCKWEMLWNCSNRFGNTY